jgi:hypothetical protein
MTSDRSGRRPNDKARTGEDSGDACAKGQKPSRRMGDVRPEARSPDGQIDGRRVRRWRRPECILAAATYASFYAGVSISRERGGGLEAGGRWEGFRGLGHVGSPIRV